MPLTHIRHEVHLVHIISDKSKAKSGVNDFKDLVFNAIAEHNCSPPWHCAKNFRVYPDDGGYTKPSSPFIIPYLALFFNFKPSFKALFKIKKQEQNTLVFWYRWWDLNPHGFPHDFESCASANSATSACYLLKNNTKNII